ncbi:MAG: DNA polymerase III subunit beta [candidate division WOR-3 bacterium]|nr:DNA polymerase III subunit beta [candidate division WOR-3 bacterium]MCX7756729.1 DNA polymerase III subunit beta [candidate division WOR-3 bacterium]MDW7987413.1 DNA polymerase III subunit beta [candidate division WOR-3 bacterium]
MIFTVERQSFLTGLQKVANVIVSKTTYAVLQNVFIEVTDKDLILKATDLDTYIEKRIPLINKKKTGKTIVSGKKLLEAVSELTAEEFNFTLKANTLILEADGSESKFSTLDPQEYPEMPAIPKENEVHLHPEVLKECFEYTGFAVSRKIDERPSMGGVYLYITPNQLEMTATDGLRLAHIKQMGNFDKELKAIIAPKVFSLFPEGQNEVKITADASKIGLEFSDTIIISRLIEGPYPDYKRVIPAKYEHYLEVPTASFIKALRCAQVFANPLSKLVILELAPKKCCIFAETPEVGEIRQEFPATYKGEELKIGFNVNLLLEICNKINAGNLVMEITTPQSAVLIKPAEENPEQELLYLVMPIIL